MISTIIQNRQSDGRKCAFLESQDHGQAAGYTYVVETAGRTAIFIAMLGLDLDNKLVSLPGDFRAMRQGVRTSLLASMGAS